MRSSRGSEENDPFDRLEAYGRRLVEGITAALGSAGVPASGTAVGSMWGIFFHPGPVRSFEAAGEAATARFARFHREMLARGIFLAPSAFEAGFLSVLHGEDELEFTLEAAVAAARAI